MSDSASELVVVGALHLDLIAQLQAAHRPAASNPVRFRGAAGGVGANVARAIGAACVPCRLIAPSAEHGLGEELLQDASLVGVRVTAVPVAGASAGRYVAILDTHGELVGGYSDTDACERVEAEHLVTALPPGAIAGLVLDANLSADALNTLLDAATAPVAALAVSPAKARRLTPLAERIALLFCNRREAASLGERDTDALLESLAEGLLERGFRRFVLTDGSAGVLVHDERERAMLAAPTDVRAAMRSVNGAGDALAGATLAALVPSAARTDVPTLASAVRDCGIPAALRVMMS